MKDIKVNRIPKVPAKIQPKIENLYYRENKIEDKNKSEKNFLSSLSYILFAFMTVSVFTYIFFVTSTFYYAIKERQVLTSKNNINQNELANIFEENKKFLVIEKSKNSKISYINVNQDISISLK